MSIFSQVKVNKPKTNKFDLSHDRKFSMEFGKLVPCFLMETVPGDKITMNTSQMVRFAPMIAPIMHQVSLYTHFFFVPNRLTWPNWEEFITGGEDGLSSPAFPTIDIANGIGYTPLMDYMGLPEPPVAVTEKVNAIPFSAFQLIYNDYYRDQNLITPADYELVNGDNNANGDLKTMRTRSWQHDYFTSALPWTQRGAEVLVPLGTLTDWSFVNSSLEFEHLAPKDIVATAIGSGPTYPTAKTQTLDTLGSLEDIQGHVGSTSINELREAFRLQEFLEKNARGGSRYIEVIASHFAVKSSDARLQRPEFLGGGKTPIQISEVLQTSSNASEPTPQGNMAGHGIGVGANNSFSYFCEEHGYIIGIVSVMPKTAYQQGIHKHFLKVDKYDYYWPSFAHLGEQPVVNKELYLHTSGNDAVFGYVPRYAEYKYLNSSVHGEFRSTLDFWHMGRIFGSQPALNQAFVECNNSEVSRVFAVAQSEQLYCHMFHRIEAERRMPYFGTPTL